MLRKKNKFQRNFFLLNYHKIFSENICKKNLLDAEMLGLKMLVKFILSLGHIVALDTRKFTRRIPIPSGFRAFLWGFSLPILNFYYSLIIYSFYVNDTKKRIKNRHGRFYHITCFFYYI